MTMVDWNQRYRNEKQIWGNAPSMVAWTVVNQLQAQPVSNEKKIFEIGCGYGRDTLFIAQNGYAIEAIDSSDVGVHQTQRLLENFITQGKATISTNHFTQMTLQPNTYDAVFSHRVLHLIPDETLPSFIEQIDRMTKPHGLVVISARSEKDRRKDDRLLSEYTYELYDRPDHVVHFWTQHRFSENFGKRFDIAQCFSMTEPESQSTGHTAHLNVMVARKR